MASTAGWYIGRIMISGVASAKGGTSPEIQDTVFQWTNATVKPTVTTVNVTDLTAIVGGPYPTKAQAEAVANGDKNTTTGLPGTGTVVPVTTSTVNSSDGNLPNPLSGLDAIGAFFNTLGEQSTWFRVVKIVGGLGLIVVGLTMMAGSNKTIQGAAGTVAKAAI